MLEKERSQKKHCGSIYKEVKMLVLGVNKVLEWCQITSGGRKYTCQTKYIDGELFFRFKKVWHPVECFISENAQELVREEGKVFLRPFTNKK